MINEETGVLETPYNLATLSKATNNPILDLGYQCCDMRPYFKYSNGTTDYYIAIHPNNVVSGTINVYEKVLKNIDGKEYDAMVYVGVTSSTSKNSIVYENKTYQYKNISENIREFFINKWSKYKPIDVGTAHDIQRSDSIEEDFFVRNNCGIEILSTNIPFAGAVNHDSLINSMMEDMNNGRFKWLYVPPKPYGTSWFRMTDFIGYNKNAINPFYMDIFNTIGPVNNGVKDIYCDTKEDTYSIKVSLGEYDKEVLPINNITTECLPLYFKKASSLGLVFKIDNGRDFGFIDPYDPNNKESEDGFLYPLIPGQEVEIPLNVKINSTYNIGAFLINKDSGDTGYYFPVKPLNVRFLSIPDIVKVDFNYYAEGKDLIIAATVTRKGDTWWWGTHRPDASIVKTRTVTNYAPYNDLPIQMYTKKASSLQWENEANDALDERYLSKNGVNYEWNGCENINSQAGIENPIDTIPDVKGMESVIFYFTFIELKDSNYIVEEKRHPGIYSDVKIEGNLYLNTIDSGYRTQKITLDRKVFEDIGWLDTINETE